MSRPGGLTAKAGHLRLFGALASGLLLVLAFPGPDLGWLVWIALVPLLLALDGLNPGQAFRLGYVSGLVAYGGLLTWITLFGLPAWFLLTAGMAIYFGAFAAGAALVAGGRRRAVLWAVPLTWVAVEVVRSGGPLGFPWGLLGLTQYRNPIILPLASVIGAFGIGAVIILVNAVVAHVITARRVSLPAAVAALIAAAVILAGATRPGPIASSQRIVAAIQPNVPPQLKGDALGASQLISGLLEQTAQARRDGAEIIVYPETAVPADLGAASDLRSAIARSADGAVVVAGAFLSGPRNAAIILGPDGSVLGRYVKRRLVPFGEAGVQRGSDAGPVATPDGVVGVAICYESAFPDLIRAAVAEGAGIIAILTNDGWFGTSAGPAQHAAHAVLRAAETGRSVIRAANTGTSMLIAPDGAVVGQVPLGTANVLAALMPVGGPLTSYVRWGWLLAPLAVAGWIATVVPAGFTHLRRQSIAAAWLAATVLIPGVLLLIARVTNPGGGATSLLTSLLVLAASVWLGRGRVLNRKGIVRSAVVSLAATGLLLIAMRAAYVQYGFQVDMGPPDGHWWQWATGYLVYGIAIEVWLRGAVFARAEQVGGWPLAAVLSTALGVVVHLGQPQEVLFWNLLTGIIFSAIRLWTRDAVGLGAARGLGDAAIAALANLR